MTNTQHTPAPWHMGKAGYDKAIYDDKGASIAVVPDMLPDDEALANARLIAAAPELLEALEDLLGYYINRPAEGRGTMDLLVTGEDIDKARAAIAKAKGEA